MVGDLLRGLAGALIVLAFFRTWLEAHLYTGLTEPQTSYTLATEAGYTWLIVVPLAGVAAMVLSLISLLTRSKGKSAITTGILICSLAVIGAVLYLMVDVREALPGPRPRFFDMTAALGNGALLAVLAGAVSVVIALMEPGVTRRRPTPEAAPTGPTEPPVPYAAKPQPDTPPVPIAETDSVSEHADRGN
jgi:hypothetical protein